MDRVENAPIDRPIIKNGVWPIMVTPFNTDGQVDYNGVRNLVELYKGIGVSGIFTLGLTSEVFELNYEESLKIVKVAIEAGEGEMPIVVVGNFGKTLHEQGRALMEFYEMGASAAIVATSILPDRHDLGRQLLKLGKLTGIPLGIYESPLPAHRLLSISDLKKVSQSKQFLFMKDTCRDNEIFSFRANLCCKTNLKLFQANLGCLPDSLKVGAAGFCGILSGIAPQMCKVICDMSDKYEARGDLHKILMELEGLMKSMGHPASSKYILKRRGLNITEFCRNGSHEKLNKENMKVLDEFIVQYNIQ